MSKSLPASATKVKSKAKAKTQRPSKTKASSKAKSANPTQSKARLKPKGPAKVKRAAEVKSVARAKNPARPKAVPKKPAVREPALLRLVRQALEDMKAVDIRVLDVRGVSDVTDYMVIAGGTSDRHLRSVADRVIQMCKASGQRPLGVEGEQQGEWVLVDLPDVMVHIMLPRTRELYQLEQLWDADSTTGRG